MILLSGSYSTFVPFDNKVLSPMFLPDRGDASRYVLSQFNKILIERKECTEECIPEGWEKGTSVGRYQIYAERSIGGAIVYHLKSDIYHCVYRVDNVIINGSVPLISDNDIKGNNPLYWRYSNDPAVSLVIRMAAISGYVIGNTMESNANTYSEVSRIIPDDDPVTKMIIMYTMLKVDSKYAYFSSDDGYLYLYTDDGFINTNDKVEGTEENDIICDGLSLYVFSPMYADIPDTLDTILLSLTGKVRTGEDTKIQQLLLDALSPGIQWRDTVMSIVSLLNIGQQDVDDMVYFLMRAVAKHKLIKGANAIFKQYPCSEPKESSS